VLLMTLWLPLFNFTRSYAPLVQRTVDVLGSPACVEVHGLSQGHIAAFRFHGRLKTQAVDPADSCPWLIINKDELPTLPDFVDLKGWNLHSNLRHPSDRDEDLLIYQRSAIAP
jgi:hypothetical protein